MRLFILLFPIIILVSSNRWNDYDVLSAHHGIMKVLPWTTQELSFVSQLHSRGDYHSLMRIVKDKLIDSDISDSARRRIERFLVEKRPPKVFQNLFNEKEKNEIDIFHSRGDVSDVLSIWKKAIDRLPHNLPFVIYEYITSSNTE